MIPVLVILILLGLPRESRAEAIHQETEAKARSTDYSAVASYKAALIRLFSVKNRSQKKPKDLAAINMRIIETYYKMAAIQFRLAHSDVKFSQSSNPLQAYRSTLNNIIRTTSEYLKAFPRSPDVSRATYLRAKAYQELNLPADAKVNFKYVIDYFPKSPDFVDSVLNLYELAVTDKDYTSALSVIRKLESHTRENYYPIILSKIAFAYFYLNEIPMAIQYIQKGINLLPNEEATAAGAEHSERGKLLSNIILFYYTGMTRKVPGFTIQNSLAFIRKTQPGPSMGRLQTYLIKLLRSNGMDDELEIFKRMLFSSETKDNSLIASLLEILENENAKKKTKLITETLSHINALQEKLSPKSLHALPSKLQSLVATIINDYQPRLKLLKDSPDGVEIESLLITAYNLILKLVEQPDMVMKIRFNYGECLVLRNHYLEAIAQFRWVAEHKDSRTSHSPLIEQAQLKSISAMYDYFNAKNRIPKQLKAKSFPEKDASASADLTQWIQWLDHYQSQSNVPLIESYIFEANRILYAEGLINLSIQRLIHFVKQYPKSKHAEAAASLVIDTEVASSKWKETIQFANDFMPLFEHSNKDFSNRLNEALSQSQLKLGEDLYQKHQYAETITLVNQLLKSHPNQISRYSDLITLAANSALQLKDKKSAQTYFSRLDLTKSSPEVVGPALLTSASLSEEAYDYESSLGIYRKYLRFRKASHTTSNDDLKDLRTKVLHFSWIIGKPKLLEEVLNESGNCDDAHSDQCEDFKIWTYLLNSGTKSDKAFTKKALSKSRTGRSSSRTLWAVIALENPKNFLLNENLELLSTLNEGWSKLETLQQFALIPRITRSIAENLKWTSRSLRSATPIKLDKKAIQKRVKLIEMMEATLQKLINFPLVRVRVTSAQEWANLYHGFSEDILKLPKPKGLSASEMQVYDQSVEELRAPFEKKKLELQKQALELASQSAVESKIYLKVKNSQTQSPGVEVTDSSNSDSEIPAILNASIFNALEADTQWTKSVQSALQESNWMRLGFLIQEGHAQKLLSEPQFSFAQGSALILMGAQSEGLSLYEVDLKKREKRMAARTASLLLKAYFECQNLKKTQEFLEYFENLSGVTPEETQMAVAAKAWIEKETAPKVNSPPKENGEKK